MPRKKPDFEYKAFMVRIHPQLHERVASLAQESHRALNGQVTLILETYFDAQALRQRADELEQRGN